MDKERLLKLLGDVDPLIKSQTQLIDYRKYHYSFKEIYALYEDKVIDLVLKYRDKPYQDLLYITLASLKRHTISISKSLSRYSYTVLEEEITYSDAQVDISNLFEKLKINSFNFLDQSMHALLDIIITPPQDITRELPSSGKIPNESYLKYLGIPLTSDNIKTFQKHRTHINGVIRDQIGLLDL